MEWIYAGILLVLLGLALGVIGEFSRRRENQTMQELLDSLTNAIAELEQFNRQGDSIGVGEKARQIQELQVQLRQGGG